MSPLDTIKQSFVVGNHFYVTEDQAQNTPSRADNISAAVEKNLRSYGSELMQEAAILLKLPQVAVSTGSVLFHRFYSRVSLKAFSVKVYAMACLYLGSKCEEEQRKMRQFIAIFQNIMQRREGGALRYFDVTSTAYMEAKAELTKAERVVLRELGFTVHVEHPHKFITSFMNFLGLQNHSALMQSAWSLMNDSLRTDLCVRLKPEAIACGCIFMAARKLNHPLPTNPTPWWHVFDVTIKHISLVTVETLSLYTNPRCEFVEVDPDKAAANARAAAAAIKAEQEEAARALAAVEAAKIASAKEAELQTARSKARESAALAVAQRVEDKKVEPKQASRDASPKRRNRSRSRDRGRDRSDRDRVRGRDRGRDRDGRSRRW